MPDASFGRLQVSCLILMIILQDNTRLPSFHIWEVCGSEKLGNLLKGTEVCESGIQLQVWFPNWNTPTRTCWFSERCTSESTRFVHGPRTMSEYLFLLIYFGDSTNGGGAESRGQRIRSRLCANRLETESPLRDSNSRNRKMMSRSRTLNRLSHPGVLTCQNV